MRSFIRFGLLAIAIAAAHAGNAFADNAHQKIIVVTHGQSNDSFWSVVKNGVMQAGKDYGVTVEYQAPQTFDMTLMAQLIDAAVNQKPNGIVVSDPDPSALGPAIKHAIAAGIPVISINSGADAAKGLGVLIHVGQDELIAGRLAGERLKAAGGKKAVCINPEPGNVSVDNRCRGFEEGFGSKAVTVPTSFDPAENEAKVRAALSSDPSIDTIMSLGAVGSGDGVLDALTKMDAFGKYKIATFDMTPRFLKAVQEGKVLFCVDQQQFLQGYLGVALMALYDRYGVLPAANIQAGPNLVTGKTANQVVELVTKGIR
jgi:simple sugar transport system substrate-binding protein